MITCVPQFAPTSLPGLVDHLTALVEPMNGRRVLAVDGSDAARPEDVAVQVAEVLRTSGRAADVVVMRDWVRPASLRLEYGRDDELSYRTLWFDHDGLQREVLDALRREGRWLPAIWNEVTDRSAREPMRTAEENHVIVVAGPMLLDPGLTFDLTATLRMSEAALLRKTPADRAWTVPALLAAAQNDDRADVVVRWDHPDRPALLIRR